MSCEYGDLDAAYVLGSLAPAERADYERHLSTCDACSRSVRELAGLPGLLARVPADVLESPAIRQPVPETLLPGLVTAARKQERRRTIRTALLSAAAVAVIAGGSAIVATSLDDDGSPEAQPSPSIAVETPERQQMEPVGNAGSKGWVTLTPTATGTWFELTCEYQIAYGGGHSYFYKLVALTADGQVHTVTGFKAKSGEPKDVEGSVEVDLDDIAAVEVRNADGDAILRLVT